MANRGAIREYVNGSLWVWPGISAVAALLVGLVVSRINVAPGSPLAPLAFQGTADDARSLLTAIAGTVVTVIALVLGLTVVALQLSSTQFSPRLLRKFLRDRANQIVLSVFVATFVYSSAGLYTVGLSAGARVEQFPRLAVSGAIVLLFASMAMVVYFADHLAHSIQVDAIGSRVEKDTLTTVHTRLDGVVETPAPTPPAWAIMIPASRSGYLQTVRPDQLLEWARGHRLVIRLRLRVGEHIVAGTVLGWVWTVSDDQPAVDPAEARSELDGAVRIGFERTLEQDAALGIRQLVDMACKALSPAVNDPYTAVQAVDHLSVIFCALAARRLGGLGNRRSRRWRGDRSGPPIRRLPGHHVRTDPPIRVSRTHGFDRAAAAARVLRRCVARRHRPMVRRGRAGRTHPRGRHPEHPSGCGPRDRHRSRRRPARCRATTHFPVAPTARHQPASVGCHRDPAPNGLTS